MRIVICDKSFRSRESERCTCVRQVGLSLLQARRYLRGVGPSKILLLHVVTRDDNSANNGEILIMSGPLITIFALVLAIMVQFNLRTVIH